jgi:hypothetical protein
VTICLGELQSDSLTELKSDNVTVHKCHAGLVLKVVQARNLNFLASEKIREGEKTVDLFILMQERNFLTFSTYPHKLQNLSFNLAV